MFEGEKDLCFSHTHTQNIPACDFGQTFEAIVKVMWFKCEGSKCRDRNSGPQKKNITKPLSILLQHQPLGLQQHDEFHYSHYWFLCLMIYTRS